MTAPEAPSLWRPPVRNVSIGATGLVGLFAVEYIAVGTAMPTVAADLDGLALYSLAFGATIAAGVVGMILGGWWSDHAGPAPAVLAGCLTFAAGLVGAGLAPTMEVFVAARGLQGLGIGLASVAIYVVIAQGVPDVLRPRMFSLLAAAWVVPGLAGPVLAGAVVETLGWRWVFLSVVPLVLASLWVLRPALGWTGPAGDAAYLRPSTIVWALVAAVSVAALNLAGPQVNSRDLLVGAPVVVLLLLATVRLLPPGTLTLRRGLPSVIASRGAIGASFLAAEAYLPLLLQQLHGYSPTGAGGVLAVGSVTWALGSWWQGSLADHVDRYRLLVVGCLVILSGAVLLVAAVLGDWPGWTILAIWGWTTLGVGFAYPTTSLLTLRLSPPASVGANSSSLQVSEALASAAVLAGAGVAFTALYAASARVAFTAVALSSVVAGLAAVLTASRTRARLGP
ncbi:MFS transporter [Ornithinimicrobium sediminis]|uniref:MFS transporter n=1 Tax=Ornithinimicrobium sediminis TaxID=2904603 RepID=UPI001E360097|nr:MFS transporter [Ornithinimicrobium sediminis]